jgi:hypothetical protein
MGLLDDFSGFIKTPEGIGLLSAVAGGLATARRGAPLNSLGLAGLAGLTGYANAQENAMQRQQVELANSLRKMQINEMLRQQRQREQIRAIARDSLLTPEQQAIGKFGPTNEGAQAISQFKPKFDTETFFSEMIREGVDPLQAMQLRQSMTPKPLTVGKNERALDPVTYKEIVPALPDLPTGMVMDKNGQMVYDPNYLQGQKDIRASGRTVSNTNVFNNTKDDFKNERDLRNDFSGLPTTKAFREVENAYDQIKVGLQKQSPAGDLAAATKIMKILDPGSVVRESELAMAMSATGLLDRIENYASMVIKGDKLSPMQRKDFGALAEQMYNAAAERYNASVDEYQSVAKDYNLNPGRIAKYAGTRKYNQETANNPVVSRQSDIRRKADEIIGR